MHDWWRRIIGRWRKRALPSRETLLNDGLELAMDWGENWLAPIQDRLRQQHPQLAGDDMVELDATCRAVMKSGQETAFELIRRDGKQLDPAECLARLQTLYPWLNAANAERLSKQSLYYAWKTGGPARSL